MERAEMMYKKAKGFSLAELLISLLIISIVLAAAIPTITKRRAHGPENIWNWSNKNNSAFFGVGHNQSAIIGYDMMPFSDIADDAEKAKKYFDIDSLNSDTTHFKFTTDGDKLVLVRRFITEENKTENMKNSHISFYNVEDRAGATTRDLIYAGRISSDQHNLAFGIASLQSLNWVELDKYSSFDDTYGKGRGYNTALGHYALSFLKGGAYNTAVGESALTFNYDANRNTAVGASALNTILGNDNTALGANAGKYIDAKVARTTLLENASMENTLIGANTLSVGISGEDVRGSGNTALGATACGSVIGNDNICVGRNTGAKASSNKLVKIEDNHGLYIGQDPYGAPLLSGHTSFNTANNIKGYDVSSGLSVNGFQKELDVNARYFRVKTYDAGRTMFEIAAEAGSNGYATGSGFGRFGRMSLSLKDIQGPGSIKMTIDGSEDPFATTVNDGMANIYFYDPGKEDGTDNPTYLPINLNNMLRIAADSSAASGGAINISKVKILSVPALEINGAVRIERNSSSPTSDIYGDSPILAIKGNGEAQTLEMYNKDGFAIMGVYKGDGTINFAASKVTIGDTATEFGVAAQVINMNPKNGFVYVKGEVEIDGIQVESTLTKHTQEINYLKTQVANASDARLKNISGDSSAGLKEINALEIKNYTYKKDEKKTPHVGVIAQQLQKVFPNSVFEGEDGYLRIRTEEIFYAMVNSIKELFAQIQDLTAKVVGLDKRLTELEQENALLKKQNAEFEKRLSKLEAKVEK